ncbi:MAG: hypothetical protein KY463_06830, partial [Actinobacteria bacterium]|nr:hypothetical protein [Actinomycetota bacterium]
ISCFKFPRRPFRNCRFFRRCRFHRLMLPILSFTRRHRDAPRRAERHARGDAPAPPEAKK